MRLFSFDLEIADPIPKDCLNWRELPPRGISCAAGWGDGQAAGEPPVTWFGGLDVEAPAPRMSAEEADCLYLALAQRVRDGYKIVTWNGLSFDFFILSQEVSPSLRKEVARMAFDLNHYDLMFHVFCKKGFGVKLTKACEGLGLEGKLEGMSGELAPTRWPDDPKTVLAYCVQDAKIQYDVARHVEQTKRFQWVTGKGKTRGFYLPCWHPAPMADLLPVPDTRWMERPWPRSGYSDWVKELLT